MTVFMCSRESKNERYEHLWTLMPNFNHFIIRHLCHFAQKRMPKFRQKSVHFLQVKWTPNELFLLPIPKKGWHVNLLNAIQIANKTPPPRESSRTKRLRNRHKPYRKFLPEAKKRSFLSTKMNTAAMNKSAWCLRGRVAYFFDFRLNKIFFINPFQTATIQQ